MEAVFSLLSSLYDLLKLYLITPEQSIFDLFPFLALVGIQNPLTDYRTVSLHNYVVVITGSNTGVGRATACQLIRMGATVVLACRDPVKGKNAVVHIDKRRREAMNHWIHAVHGKVLFAPLDLSDLATVRVFVQKHLKDKFNLRRIDVLINNAGVNTCGTTKHGLQQLFQVNYLGHFLLVQECITLLQSTECNDIVNTSSNIDDIKRNVESVDTVIPACGRVVNLSSVMHHMGTNEYKSCATTPYGSTFYSDSKYYMNLLTLEINRRYGRIKYMYSGDTSSHKPVLDRFQRPVNAISCNPGAVRSDIWRSVPAPILWVYDMIMRVFFLNVEQGAGSSVLASIVEIDLLRRYRISSKDRVASVVALTENSHKSYEMHPLIPYLQPYYMPYNNYIFEMISLYAGPQWAHVTISPNLLTTANALWEYSIQLCDDICDN